MKKHLPNSVTLLNLFLGCAAILAVLFQQVDLVFGLILAAAVADFVDGALARGLGVRSQIGQELDSLADLVSFGVVPGAIFYVLLVDAWKAPLDAVCFQALPGFLVTLFSAIRLARFNIDHHSKEDFLGLPTPSSTIFVAGLFFMYHADVWGGKALLGNPWVLYALIGLVCFLLLSNLPMFSLKFRHFRWKGNELRFLLVAAIPLFFFLSWDAAPALIIGAYILLSLGQKIIQ